MKRLVLLAALLGLCGALCLPMAAKKRIFQLEDYGIVPGDTSRTLCSRLREALTLIRQQTRPGEEATVRFKRGTYNFHATDAETMNLYISNHDQNQPKKVGILLDNWDGLTLDGNGAQFVFHGRMLPLVLRRSTGCRLEDFSIDFAQPQIAQVEIVGNDENNGITFRVEPWVDYDIASNGNLEIRGEGWTAQPVSGIAFEPDTRHIVYNTGDLGINTNGVRTTGERTLLAPNWKDKRLQPGTKVALRTWLRPAPGIFLEENTDTRLEKISVHYAEGMGLLAQRCTDISLRKFNVCLKGKTDPRYFTTQADATHFSQCRGRIVSENGLYENMMDDAINVHGVYLKVAERVDDHTLRCRFEHGQAWGFSWGDPGDTVAFIRAYTMEYVEEKNTIADIRPAGQNSVSGTREFIIRFSQPVPECVSTAEAYGVENLTWTPEVEFRGNVVRNNRARGALFSSPRRTFCEKNLFDHTSGAAILLCGDCNGWYESGAVRDLTIRKNKFVNALTNLFQFTNAVISIYPEIPALQQQKAYFHGGRANAIVIEDNEFETFDAPLLYAKSVDGLLFINNKVKKNNDYQPFHWNTQPVLLERCKNAVTPGYVGAPPVRPHIL